MPMPRFRVRLLVGVSTFILVSLASAGPEAGRLDPWQTALSFDYNIAAERFAKLHEESPGDPRLAVAYASSLLVRQPRTESNILSARDLLLALSKSSHAYSPITLYLLARIETDHLAAPDLASARRHLERLRREHPEHPLADDAAVELADFAAFLEGRDTPEAVAHIETLLATAHTPPAIRDLHLILFNLKLRRLKASAAALPHLVAARAVGFEQPRRNADIDLSIANLARETGDLDLARRHYEAFVAAAPRDVRADTVRRSLASGL